MYNAYEKDIAVVNLYFGDSTVFGDSFGIIFLSRLRHAVCNCFKTVSSIFLHSEYETAPKMPWLDFISSLGGICGLCLGISFVSVTELVYWFSVRFSRSLVMHPE